MDGLRRFAMRLAVLNVIVWTTVLVFTWLWHHSSYGDPRFAADVASTCLVIALPFLLVPMLFLIFGRPFPGKEFTRGSGATWLPGFTRRDTGTVSITRWPDVAPTFVVGLEALIAAGLLAG